MSKKKKLNPEPKVSPRILERTGYNFPQSLWPPFVQIVKEIVSEKQGIKGVELVVQVTKDFAGSELSSNQILQGIEKCVTLGHIVELEYSLPEGSNGFGKIKSMFFPAKTKLFLNDE